ncbi:response regulator transcription factor [Sphingobacterium corticibacterium]|uniref:Response regulator transcription factor n=1 Tax=Sphingobacterium corticibacterium TaxID=2484746 RepID=A0A4V2DBF7_9SPHI|nr:response regulator transcription factor [Sphingobacterium corticibacterium]RZF57466.1 response regulator transcription factor [Sphingobacterium corticibacterium]
MNTAIKVFLVDDHEIFRNGLKQLIDREEDMEVVGEAADGETALEDLVTIIPDVIIMDIRMPGINGIETAEAILRLRPNSKIIFFSLYDSPDYVTRALDMKASGFILKDTSNKIFLNAIRSVYAGRFYFIGEVTDILVKKYLDSRTHTNANKLASPGSISLSRRELEIIKMTRDHLSTKEVAEILNVSIRTVEAHRQNILRKFHTKNMDEVLQALDSDAKELSTE